MHKFERVRFLYQHDHDDQINDYKVHKHQRSNTIQVSCFLGRDLSQTTHMKIKMFARSIKFVDKSSQFERKLDQVLSKLDT